MTKQFDESRLPVGLALIAALLWGLWWIPIRAIEAVGLPGPWAGVAMTLGATPLLLASLFVLGRRERVTAHGLVGAALIGVAMMSYAAAVTQTEIVRAVLLFYLAPAWSIAIECLFMSRRLRGLNFVAFACAAAGIALIFRGEVSFANWNIGDVLALAAGFFWAVGSAFFFVRPGVGVVKVSLIACVAGSLLGLALIWAFDAPPPSERDVAGLVGASVLSGSAYLAPVILATLWSASRLSPATLSFLLTAEIISGVGSSALLLDERFGAPEAIGAVLVMLAATIEVFATRGERRTA